MPVPVSFHCPYCSGPAPVLPGSTNSKRITTGYRRVRKCRDCGHKFTTFQPTGGQEAVALTLQQGQQRFERVQISFGRERPKEQPEDDEKGRKRRELRYWLQAKIRARYRPNEAWDILERGWREKLPKQKRWSDDGN